MLQFCNRFRRPHVFFAAHAVGVFTAGIQCVGQHRVVAERFSMSAQGFLGHFEHADTADVGGCAGEVLVHHR